MAAEQVQQIAGGVPWLGHVMRLVRGPLAFLASQREGPGVARMQLAGRWVYLANGGAAARQALMSRTFDKGGPFMDTARVLVGNGVITCSNADHRRQQPVMRPAFHRDQVARYAPVVGDCITQAIGGWRAGEHLDVEARIYKLAAQVVARTLIAAPGGREAADTMASSLPVLLEGMFRQMLPPRARDARTGTDFDPDPGGGEDAPAPQARVTLRQAGCTAVPPAPPRRTLDQDGAVVVPGRGPCKYCAAAPQPPPDDHHPDPEQHGHHDDNHPQSNRTRTTHLTSRRPGRRCCSSYLTASQSDAPTVRAGEVAEGGSIPWVPVVLAGTVSPWPGASLSFV